MKTLWNTSFENHWNLMGKFWKHFETHHLKTIETYGEFWKHPTDTPLNYGHSGVTIETLGFQMALKWNTSWCAVMHGEKICFFHAVESRDFTTTMWSNNLLFCYHTPLKIFKKKPSTNKIFSNLTFCTIRVHVDNDAFTRKCETIITQFYIYTVSSFHICNYIYKDFTWQ